MANPANEWMKGKIAALRAAKNNKCDICGKKGNSRTLQFYHKRKTALTGVSKRGRKERYYDIINNPKCYGLGHRICHMKKYRIQHNTIKKEKAK